MDQNEFETIVFEDSRIKVLSNLEEYQIEDDPPLEWLIEDPPNIYSDNHPWDASRNFWEYLMESGYNAETLYVPRRHGKYIAQNFENIKLIQNFDRFSPLE